MARSARGRKPEMVRGSVVTHRRRCGRPNCRCADGDQLHESTVLSYSESNKTRFLMLPAEEVEAVRDATEAYRRAKSAVETAGNAGLGVLVQRLSPRSTKG
jgi:hypothetical protein